MNKAKKNAATLERPGAISAKELAKVLSLSSRTVWRLLSASKLPKPVSIGGSKRFLISDVNLFLECNCDMVAFKARKEIEKC